MISIGPWIPNSSILLWTRNTLKPRSPLIVLLQTKSCTLLSFKSQKLLAKQIYSQMTQRFSHLVLIIICVFGGTKNITCKAMNQVWSIIKAASWCGEKMPQNCSALNQIHKEMAKTWMGVPVWLKSVLKGIRKESGFWKVHIDLNINNVNFPPQQAALLVWWLCRLCNIVKYSSGDI